MAKNRRITVMDFIRIFSISNSAAATSILSRIISNSVNDSSWKSADIILTLCSQRFLIKTHWLVLRHYRSHRPATRIIITIMTIMATRFRNWFQRTFNFNANWIRLEELRFSWNPNSFSKTHKSNNWCRLWACVNLDRTKMRSFSLTNFAENNSRTITPFTQCCDSLIIQNINNVQKSFNGCMVIFMIIRKRHNRFWRFSIVCFWLCVAISKTFWNVIRLLQILNGSPANDTAIR